MLRRERLADKERRRFTRNTTVAVIAAQQFRWIFSCWDLSRPGDPLQWSLES
jgi:hypothetical protein